MQSHYKQPSTKPVAQRVKPMVSNSFEILRFDSDSESLVLDGQHEVVAPHANDWHSDAEVPHVLLSESSFLDNKVHPKTWRVEEDRATMVGGYFLVDWPAEFPTVYKPPDRVDTPLDSVIGNYSRLTRDIHIIGENGSKSELLYSFIRSLWNGDLDLGSSVLLSRYFRAGVSVDHALDFIIRRNKEYVPPPKKRVKDDYRLALEGSWHKVVALASHVLRSHRTEGLLSTFPLVPVDYHYESQVSDMHYSGGQYYLHYGVRDLMFYDRIATWQQTKIKEGSFNPYGNGQPVCNPNAVLQALSGCSEIEEEQHNEAALDCAMEPLNAMFGIPTAASSGSQADDDIPSDVQRWIAERNGRPCFALDQLLGSYFDDGSNYERSVDDIVDSVFDESSRVKANSILNGVTVTPVTNVDLALKAVRVLSPLCSLFYQLYSAKSKTDAIVAAWTYIERMSVEDDYASLKVGIGWASSYLIKFKKLVEMHLDNAYEFLMGQIATKGVNKLQSSDKISEMMDFLTNITSGAQSNARAQSFVWLVAFVFTSISAARSGVFVSFNEYSKRSMEFVNKCFLYGSTGVTVSLFAIALKNCYEMVSELFAEGISTLWRNEYATIRKLRTTGEELLRRSLLINTQAEFKELVQYGRDLDAFLGEYETTAPKMATRQIGINLFGMGANTETNTAIMWSAVKKIAGELMLAQSRYKLMLVSISYRSAPFAIAAVGGSSLGKSLWTQATAATINAYLGIKHDPALIYTFNPASDYMDGYKVFQTVAVLDDVATMQPDYCVGGDPQVRSVINMINNVPWLTPQADLPDKKTCPFASRAVLITSNSKDFNAPVYATNPAALLRRIKYRVTLDVAPDFANAAKGLDPVKAAAWQAAQSPDDVNFPPYWIYTVDEMVAVNRGSDANKFKMEVQYVRLMNKAKTEKYLAWFRSAWEQHESAQTAAVDQVKSLCGLTVCDHCHLPRPYHASNCPGVVNGTIVPQSLDVVVTTVSAVGGGLLPYAAIAVAIALVCRFAKFVVDALTMCRDKSMVTMAMMEDASNQLSMMAVTWRKIGTPIAVCVGGLGFVYSWFMVGFGAVWLALSLFPLRRVAAVLQSRNTMLMVTTMIAGALLVRNLIKTDKKDEQRGAEVQSKDSPTARRVESNESTCDFSANDQSAKWGDGMSRAYTGDALTVAFSPKTNTTRGASQDGALTAIKRAIFVARITSSNGPRKSASTCNGFVYSMNPPIIAINNHSLFVHQGSDEVTIKMMFTPNNGGEHLSDDMRHASNVHSFTIKSGDIAVNLDYDLAMIYVHGMNRRGISEYLVHDIHQNGGVNPSLYSRSVTGSIMARHLNGYKHHQDFVLGNGDKVARVKNVYSYNVDTPTVDGESGALLVLFVGNVSLGELGGIGVAGMHAAYDSGRNIAYCTKLGRETCSELASIAHRNYTSRLRGSVGETNASTWQCLQDFTPDGSHNNIFDLEKGSSQGRLLTTHHKAAINWIGVDNGQAAVFGSIVGDARTTQGLRTGYIKTRWSEPLGAMTDSVLGDTTNKFTPTVVDRDNLWKVHHRTLTDLVSTQASHIPDEILNNAVAGYVEDVITGVDLSGNNDRWRNFGVLSTAEAINGVDGQLESIVWTTGGGFGYSGPKAQHKEKVEGGIPNLRKTEPHYTLSQDVMDSIEEAEELIRNGVDPGFVYQAHLKDEVRTREKVADHKIRMICGASIPAIVLARKYLAPLIIFMAQNPLTTECAVGMNSESQQWGDLARYLREYGGTERFLAGDFVNFDKNQTLQMTLAVSQAMYALVLHAHALYPTKYNEGDLMAIRVLLSGLCYPKYDHFGVLLGILGTNPSGNSLTAQRNCIANSLYMRCAFMWLALTVLGMVPRISRRLYAKVVRQINYGDDLLSAVRDGFEWYNHDTITHALSRWGVPFTHADKSTATGKRYDHFDEVTFLKRSFVFNTEIGDYLAPLDLSSVVKGLHYYQQRNNVSYDMAHAILLRTHAENVLSHGREKYDRFCAEARYLASSAGLADQDYVEATKFPSWDDFIQRWKDNSKNPKFSRFPDYPKPPPIPLIDGVTEEFHKVSSLI